MTGPGARTMPSLWLYTALLADTSSPSLAFIRTLPFMSRLVWFSPTLASSLVATNVLPSRTEVTFTWSSRVLPSG